MEKINLLSEFASGPRLEILKILEKSDAKPAQIAKQTNTSIQALTRHLERLSNSKLIEKTQNGSFSLTPIAKTSLFQLPFFDFLSKHNDFFLNHTFDGIPDSLLSRLGDLNGGELEVNPMKAIQKARDVYVNSKEWFHACAYTIPLEMYDYAENKLKNKVNLNMVVGKNTFVPNGYYSDPKRKFWEKYAKNGLLEEKFVEHIPINVVVTELDAHLIFANKELGQPLEPIILFGKDELFRKWCTDLFEYYWNDVPKIPEFKLQER